MKKVLAFLLAISWIASLQAQSATEILEKYFENTGGKDSWTEMKTMRTEASMSMQGMEFDGTIYAKYPNKQRVNVVVNGTQIVQAYDGETAWWINPFMGSTEAQKMPEDMAEGMTRQEFQSPFLNYDKKGYTVELTGEKEVNGTPAHEIKLTKQNGEVEYHYFDKENYLPVKVAMTLTSGQAQGQTVETFLGNFEKVDGLTMPFSLEVKLGGQTLQKLTFKEVVLNEEMKDDFFAYPKK